MRILNHLLVVRFEPGHRWECDKISSLALDWNWLSVHAGTSANIWQDNLGDILAAAQVIREKIKDGEAMGSAFEHVLNLQQAFES